MMKQTTPAIPSSVDNISSSGVSEVVPMNIGVASRSDTDSPGTGKGDGEQTCFESDEDGDRYRSSTNYYETSPNANGTVVVDDEYAKLGNKGSASSMAKKGVLRRNSQPRRKKRRNITFSDQVMCRSISIVSLEKQPVMMSNIMSMNFDEFGNMIPPELDDDWSDDDYEEDEEEDDDEDDITDENDTLYSDDGGLAWDDHEENEELSSGIPAEHSAVVEIPLISLTPQQTESVVEMTPALSSSAYPASAFNPIHTHQHRFRRTQINSSTFSTTIGSPLIVRRTIEVSQVNPYSTLPSSGKCAEFSLPSAKDLNTSVTLPPSITAQKGFSDDTPSRRGSPLDKPRMSIPNEVVTVDPVVPLTGNPTAITAFSPSPTQLRRSSFTIDRQVDVSEARRLSATSRGSPRDPILKASSWIDPSETDDNSEYRTMASKDGEEDDELDNDVASVDVRVGDGDALLIEDHDLDEDVSQYVMSRSPQQQGSAISLDADSFSSRLTGVSPTRYQKAQPPNSGSLGDVADKGDMEFTKVVRFRDELDTENEEELGKGEDEDCSDEDEDDREGSHGVSLVKVISMGKVESAPWVEQNNQDAAWESSTQRSSSSMYDDKESDADFATSGDQGMSDSFKEDTLSRRLSRTMPVLSTGVGPRADAWLTSSPTSNPLNPTSNLNSIESLSTPLLADATAQSKIFNTDASESVPVVVIKIPSAQLENQEQNQTKEVTSLPLPPGILARRHSVKTSEESVMSKASNDVPSTQSPLSISEQEVNTSSDALTNQAPRTNPLQRLKKQLSKEYQTSHHIQTVSFANNPFVKFMSGSSERLHFSTKMGSSESLHSGSLPSPPPTPLESSRPNTADPVLQHPSSSTLSAPNSTQKPQKINRTIATIKSTFSGHTSLRSLAASLGGSQSSLGRFRAVSPDSGVVGDDSQSLRLHDDTRMGKWRFVHSSKSSCNLPETTVTPQRQIRQASTQDNIDIITIDPPANYRQTSTHILMPNSQMGSSETLRLSNCDEQMNGCSIWMRKQKDCMGRSLHSLSESLTHFRSSVFSSSRHVNEQSVSSL
jgi:hypothetical protein